MDPFKLYMLYLGIGAIMGALFSGIIFTASFLDMRHLNRMREDYLDTVIAENTRLKTAEMNEESRRAAAALINLDK